MSNLSPSIKIHSTADVQSFSIGDHTTVWQFSVILQGAIIGSNCNINSHTFIENDVIIGNNVTIKCGVYLWDGITLENNVFIGPNVTFTNDVYPRSKSYPEKFQCTLIKKGASVGANATILGGSVIGSYSLVGAGAVVTRSVPDFAVVLGNPAKIIGWIDEEGNKLIASGDEWQNVSGKKFKVEMNRLVPLK